MYTGVRGRSSSARLSPIGPGRCGEGVIEKESERSQAFGRSAQSSAAVQHEAISEKNHYRRFRPQGWGPFGGSGLSHALQWHRASRGKGGHMGSRRTGGIGIGAFVGSVLGGILGRVALGPGVGLYIGIVLGALIGASLAGALVGSLARRRTDRTDRRRGLI